MKLKGSLFRKYVVYFVVLVSVALIASGLVGLYFTYQENREALLNLQREKARAAASRIETYVLEIEHQLGWMRFPPVGAMTAEQRRIDYLKLLRQVSAITDAVLLDHAGREQLRVSRLGMDQIGGEQDWSKDPKFMAADSGKAYFSPVYFRKETEPYMTIVVKGVTPEAGVTIAEVNLKFIWDVISRIKIGQMGLAYVVDARGQLIAHPDISQVLQKLDLSHLEHVKAARAASGDDDDRVSVSYNTQRHEVLTAHAGIPALGWYVFVEQPIAEAFAPLYASLMCTALLLLAGIVFAIAASMFLARRMVTPIQSIRFGAERLGSGDLGQQIEVRTGDELEALGNEFNNMAAKLRDSYADLERKVEERTVELKESLEQQTAIAAILGVISRSHTDVIPVLEAVARNAAELCGSSDAHILMINGSELRYVAGYGDAIFDASHPVRPLTRDCVMGRVVIDRSVVHVEDMAEATAIAEYPAEREAQRKQGFHAVLGVPLLKGDEAIGVIVLHRGDARPFGEKQIQLLRTFADQVVISVENIRLFNEIQDKRRQLEIANRHKSEFLASMSHELRTPLNAVIGFSEVLQEKMFGEVNAKQMEYLADIHSSGIHLLSLINDILDLSKIEAGRMDLQLARFDIAGALNNAMTLIRERATRQDITLTLEVAGDVEECIADERKFKQILLNLLSNAVKFTPKGGHIGVTACSNADEVTVTVADTGIGIAREDLLTVFEEFRQVGTDHLRKAEGTGLGLALTRRFVELHGGVITVASEPGKGSTFTFTIPQRPSEVAA